MAIGIAAIMAEIKAGKSISISEYGKMGKSWSIEHRTTIINSNRKVGTRRREW
tara:strand:- start:329 stop:487 length:159 start_codon:yes stop_codon:yes gene_type:complete